MPITIHIAIIEDEEAAVKRLLKELNKLEPYRFEVVANHITVNDTVQWIRSDPKVDLIFMDIQLADGLSFEVFKQVEIKCPVIFTTAYDEYALKAFKVNSLDYLLKPIDPDELAKALERYTAQSERFTQETYMNQLLQLTHEFRKENFRSSFLVSFRHKMILINVSEVAYLYIKERGVFLKRKDGSEYIVEFFLDELEKQLDPAQFYRANRQYLVARSAISEIEPYFTGRLLLTVKPEPPAPIIISKEKATDFKRWADY